MGFLGVLIGAMPGVFLLPFCDLYLLIYLFVIPEAPPYAMQPDAPIYQQITAHQQIQKRSPQE
jgi:hypothetical protein